MASWFGRLMIKNGFQAEQSPDFLQQFSPSGAHRVIIAGLHRDARGSPGVGISSSVTSIGWMRH
jgi:hypothetical protein